MYCNLETITQCFVFNLISVNRQFNRLYLFQVSDNVVRVLKEDRLCLTIGGDHSCGIGTIDGHVKAKGDVAVLWVDAHADLNTNATSPTGNIHGMPVALLVKELSDYWPYLPGMDCQQPM